MEAINYRKVMKLFLSLGVLLASMCLSGCIDLAVNDGKNKHIDPKKITQTKGEVYTMRGGLGGIFSKGMNRLEDKLENDYQIYASSTVWYKANTLSRYIIAQYKLKKVHGPIILVGHSLGANEQIKVARDLASAGIPVALLMTIDAVSPVTVPPNVKQVFNIYKPSFVPLFSGLKLKAMDPTRTDVENFNVTTIKDTSVNHFTIDGNEEVQRLMLDKVLATISGSTDYLS